MGGKSSSSSKSTQETIQQSSEGVVTGTVIQGENVHIQEEFGEGVQNAFKQLTEIAGQSLNLANEAGSFAIEQVADRRNFEQAPVTATVKNSINPALLAGVSIVALYALTKGKK